MKRQALAAMLALANETDDEELKYQALMACLNFGERVGHVPAAEDAEAAG